MNAIIYYSAIWFDENTGEEKTISRSSRPEDLDGVYRYAEKLNAVLSIDKITGNDSDLIGVPSCIESGDFQQIAREARAYNSASDGQRHDARERFRNNGGGLTFADAMESVGITL